MNYGQHNISLTSTALVFEMISAVDMKTSIFRDITPCCPVKVNVRFGRTYLLHLQVRRGSHGSNLHETCAICACFVVCSCLDYSFTFKVKAIRFSETSIDFHTSVYLFYILQLCISPILLCFPLVNRELHAVSFVSFIILFCYLNCCFLHLISFLPHEASWLLQVWMWRE
jgi:hypothetical protein